MGYNSFESAFQTIIPLARFDTDSIDSLVSLRHRFFITAAQAALPYTFALRCCRFLQQVVLLPAVVFL